MAARVPLTLAEKQRPRPPRSRVARSRQLPPSWAARPKPPASGGASHATTAAPLSLSLVADAPHRRALPLPTSRHTTGTSPQA